MVGSGWWAGVWRPGLESHEDQERGGVSLFAATSHRGWVGSRGLLEASHWALEWRWANLFNSAAAEARRREGFPGPGGSGPDLG